MIMFPYGKHTYNVTLYGFMGLFCLHVDGVEGVEC